MKNFFLAIILAFLASCGVADVASAGGNTISHHNTYVEGGGGGQGGAGGVGIGVGGNSNSNSSANAGAASASGSASSSSLTYNEARQDYSDTYEDYTPNAYAPSVNTTVPCLVPITAGVGIPGVAVSGGSGVIDQGCEDREIIRLGLASGDTKTQRLANTALRVQLGDLLVRQEQARLESDLKEEKQHEDAATASAYGWFAE